MKRHPLRLKIPDDMREQLSKDPFMKECIVGVDCEGRIEWQHAFTYAGKRKNELWAILPMCHLHHLRESKYREIQQKAMKFRIKDFHLEEDVKLKYPKASQTI